MLKGAFGLSSSEIVDGYDGKHTWCQGHGANGMIKGACELSTDKIEGTLIAIPVSCTLSKLKMDILVAIPGARSMGSVARTIDAFSPSDS
jgi:hypothetical protein